MIVDCFCFHDELDLLELRLLELSPYVDRFVVVEADKTHSGRPKPFHFVENKERFKEWGDRISWVGVSLPSLPADGNRWVLENTQRNAILSGFHGVTRGDTILIGDLDEFPMLAGWEGEEGVFRMTESYYKMDRFAQGGAWNGTCAVNAWRFGSVYGPMTPQDVRNFRDLLKPCGYGWHFSWLGDPQKKLDSFAHTEPGIAERVAQGLHPGTGQTLVTQDPSTIIGYPKAILENRHRFPHLFS